MMLRKSTNPWLFPPPVMRTEMHVETIDEFLARGGKITVCPTAGRDRDRMLGIIGRIQPIIGGSYIAWVDSAAQHFPFYGADWPFPTAPKPRMRITFDLDWHDGRRRAVNPEIMESVAGVIPARGVRVRA